MCPSGIFKCWFLEFHKHQAELFWFHADLIARQVRHMLVLSDPLNEQTISEFVRLDRHVHRPVTHGRYSTADATNQKITHFVFFVEKWRLIFFPCISSHAHGCRLCVLIIVLLYNIALFFITSLMSGDSVLPYRGGWLLRMLLRQLSPPVQQFEAFTC